MIVALHCACLARKEKKENVGKTGHQTAFRKSSKNCKQPTARRKSNE